MADGITRIAVEGFKSIAKRQEIEIRPLTILAGANSSGKSSIMQPLLMLKQTLEAQYDPGPLKMGGPNVKFTSVDEFLSRVNGRNRPLSIGLSTEGLDLEVRFEKTESGFDIVDQFEKYPDGKVRHLQPRMTPEEIEDALDQTAPAQVFRERCFLHWGFAAGMPLNPFRIESMLQETIHVPGLRGNPERTYPVTGTGPLYPGTFENYVASVILRWQKDKLTNDADLNGDLQKIHMAKCVFAHRISDVAVELRVGMLSEQPHKLDNIADVGFGVSQVLPVLVALRAADGGRLVYLEEPEIHLHPRAQTKLADVLADAAKRGVRVVAETHSALLLTAIQTLVAKGELDRELVKLHWFQRDPRSGITRVCSADLDENGAFGDWPEDFDDVALSAEQGYMDAVTERSSN